MSLPYARRRAEFLARLGPRAVAIVPGAREVMRNGDNAYRFRQPADFFYLTGFPEPDAVAVFAPDHAARFTLFLRPRDPERETWTGRRAGLEGGCARYGAEQALDIRELEERLFELLHGADSVYLHLGENVELDTLVLRVVARLRKAERSGARAPLRLVDVGPLLHEMRLLKDDDGLRHMRRAVAITAEAHQLAMRATRAGRFEYEIEALIDYTFRKYEGVPGYGTIVGGGDNATVLHYVENLEVLRAGQILLVDAGCEWRGYTGDVTRSYPIPAPGERARFSPAQRKLYEVVLRAQLAGIQHARPGSTVEEIHAICSRHLTEGLVELGLLSGDPETLYLSGAHRRYYLHRTSHWLGMDVHDVGRYFPGQSTEPHDAARRFEPGMILTIEPGLYVREDDRDAPAELRGTGIRIEDDVLITPTGHEVLTRDIPKHPDELEALIGTGATLSV